MEKWKNIQTYKGYQASSEGRIRNINKGIILTQYDRNKQGYKAVTIDGKPISVHRLVAEAFLPNPYNYPVVNHKDENPSNNCVYNLEWCTQQYNCNYGTRNKRIGDKRGTPIISIDKDGKECYYKSAFECCYKTGYDFSNILKCCKGQRQKAHKHKWMFVDDWLGDWWEQEMEKVEF